MWIIEFSSVTAQQFALSSLTALKRLDENLLLILRLPHKNVLSGDD